MRPVLRRRDLIWVPFVARAQDRPKLPDGIQIGDVEPDRAIVWARSDRPGELTVEWSTTQNFQDRRTVRGSAATPQTGGTARVDLAGLPPGQTIFVRARFGDGDPAEGRFRSAPGPGRDVKFLWSGDTCGQGYGINPDWGGMRIYETMRRAEPDFFIHSGDTVYADNPVPAEVKLRDGSLWRNLTTEAKSKVAETLDEFRGAYQYNLLDANVRRFNAEVPQVWQWDDHEVLNNWSPGKDLTADSRYKEKNIATLAARARQAFLEYAPMRLAGTRPRIYRRIPYGPLVDVFVLDMRTYRAANSFNRQTAAGAETAFLGRQQFEWLKRDLARSRAAWKVIAADMPLGLLVADGKDAQGRPMFEAVANGDGPVLGREFEVADLLAFLKRRRIGNTIWLTADVHYTAAHFYDPGKAQFSDFDPFWEFVSGPLNAGTFGPGVLDNTFGPQVVFAKAPPPGQANLPPSAGLQFFGEVEISARTRELTVRLRDVAGATLYTKTLAAAG